MPDASRPGLSSASELARTVQGCRASGLVGVVQGSGLGPNRAAQGGGPGLDELSKADRVQI